MENENDSSLRSRPPPAEVAKQNLAKIDAELARCNERLTDLRLLRSLEAKAEPSDT